MISEKNSKKSVLVIDKSTIFDKEDKSSIMMTYFYVNPEFGTQVPRTRG